MDLGVEDECVKLIAAHTIFKNKQRMRCVKTFISITVKLFTDVIVVRVNVAEADAQIFKGKS